MKNKYLFLGLFPLFTSTQGLNAQNNPSNGPIIRCGTTIPDAQWENQFSELVKQTKANLNANKQQAVPYTIPVIIHVVHGGQPVGTYPNLSQGQLISQVQTLNNDYGGIGYNSSNYPINAFVNFASNEGIPSANLDLLKRVKIADCGVQFCLATKDTLGNLLAEPGIDRINYVSHSWSNPASVSGITQFMNFINGTIKPQTIWNVSKYLNIWVTDENINANSLLGYATFPPLTGLTGIPSATSNIGSSITDGFWCYSKAFGSVSLYPSGTYYPNYTFGRNCTHEIGHWLGLRHTWGDAGQCGGSDYCDDTPPQKGAANLPGGPPGCNFGSPAYPLHANTCTMSGQANDDGDMFMNFMDYVNDNAKYMFTTDQSIRMQTSMTNSPYRKFLGSHNLCSVTEIAANSNFNSAASICEGAALTLSNQSVGTPVPGFTWSATGGGNAAFFPNNNSAYTVTFPTAGIYTITLSSFNGTLSTVSKTVTVKPSPVLTFTPQRTSYCIGETIGIFMDGGVSNYWQPDSTLDTYVFVPSDKAASFSYTCFAVGSNACKTSSVVNVNVIDCTGLHEAFAENNSFSVYPNPGSNIINIESKNLLLEGTKIELVDAIGKTLLLKTINKDEQKNKINLDISDLNKGLYILKITRASQVLNSKILLKE